MAEDLFGRVSLGGVVPTPFEVDFDTLFKERQAAVADRQVAVSEGNLKLKEDRLDREKFTQDRSLRLAAAGDVAGFDISKLPNHLALSFKYNTDAFQNNFNSGEMSPEEITAESLRLSSLYNEYTGFYGAQRQLVSNAFDDPKILDAYNASLAAGEIYSITETVAQMDAKAGIFWEKNTYDPKTNKAVFVLSNGDKKEMTLEEAFRHQSLHGDIPSINSIGPYMLSKTDVDLGNLYDEATGDKENIAVRSDGEWSETSAGEVFDFRVDGDKAFRGMLRQESGLTLTEEEKIAFDNKTYILDPNYTGPSKFDAAKFDAIIARAREKYIEGSKYTKPEEKATATDKEYYRNEADKTNKQGSYLNSIKSQVSTTSSGFVDGMDMTKSPLNPGEDRTVVEAVNVPVPEKIVQTIKGIGSANITGLTITPDKRFYVTGYDSENQDLSREIDGGEVASILQKINEYFAFGSNDMLSLEKILDKANKGGYETLPFRGLNLDVIDPVEGEEEKSMAGFNKK